MKKFLSLVLALVMTMSLVTVAGAEDFTDDSKITYEEAVDVMSAVGVVGGYADGSFNPAGTLTRGAAAKIICNMILGPTTAGALAANEAPFKDVPADHTFAGYIAYCVNEGIISGYADGTFRPAGTLTGYAFWKMLLGALGYDAEIEGYVGSNWSVQVAKRGMNLGLNDGLEGKFVGTKALTREEACLYAFNAMNCKMVEYDNNSTIVVGDITIKNNSIAKQTTVFYKEYFEDLKKTTAADGDAFGRPAHTWKNGKTEIGTYSDTADYVVVLDDDYTKDWKGLLDYIWEETDNDDLHAEGAKIKFNGDSAKGDDYKTKAYAGTVLELFCNDVDTDKKDADENLVTEIVAYAYDLVKIDSVSEKVSSAAAKKDAEYTIKLETTAGANAGTFYDAYKGQSSKVLAGFDADTYTEGTYIAIVKGEKGIIDSYVAESVSGKLTAYKASSYIELDDTQYALANGLTTGELDFDEEYTVYLSKDGYVLYIDGETGTSISDVYYVTYVYDKETKGNKTYYAEVVTLDGEVKDLVISEDTAKALGDGIEGELYILTENSDDEFEVELKDSKAVAFTGDKDYKVTASDGAYTKDIKATAGSVTLGTKVYLGDTTKFVAVKTTKSGAVKEVKTAEGGMSYAGSNKAEVIAIYDDNKDAAYVLYVGGTLSSTVSTDDVVFVTALSDDVVAKGVYNTDVWFMDGVVSDTIEVKGQEGVGFYTYSIIEDGYYELTKVTTKLSGDVVDTEADGWHYIDFVDAKIHNNTVTYEAEGIKFIDADFAGAEVIDLRTDAEIAADNYDYEITSVSDLVDAAKTEKVNGVTAYVYTIDGVIEFVAVTLEW